VPEHRGVSKSRRYNCCQIRLAPPARRVKIGGPP